MSKSNDHVQQVCEAASCNHMATTKLDILISGTGILTISVCDGCIKKFETSASSISANQDESDSNAFAVGQTTQKGIGAKEITNND